VRRTACISLAVLCVFACQKVELGILTNAADQSLHVTYQLRRTDIAGRERPECDWGRSPVYIRRTPRNDRNGPEEWVPSDVRRVSTSGPAW